MLSWVAPQRCSSWLMLMLGAGWAILLCRAESHPVRNQPPRRIARPVRESQAIYTELPAAPDATRAASPGRESNGAFGGHRSANIWCGPILEISNCTMACRGLFGDN
jgi:hypothetical protein